jgi:hypothetical protein
MIYKDLPDYRIDPPEHPDIDVESIDEAGGGDLLWDSVDEAIKLMEYAMLEQGIRSPYEGHSDMYDDLVKLKTYYSTNK